MLRITFGLMTARENPGAVLQLVDALGRDDAVVIHHDERMQPRFEVAHPNVSFVERTARTGWGTAGFCRGLFRLIRTALETTDFDHFQLLSGSCLPLRPIGQLRASLAAAPHAIRADAIDLDRDARALLSHGHRVYARPATIGGKVLRRARRLYFSGANESLDHEGLGLLVARRNGLAQRLGRSLHQMAQLGAFDTTPFTPGFRPFVGSTWFCLRRDVCEWLVAQEESHPAVPYLLSLNQCDEILFPSLLMNQRNFDRAPSNHTVSRFDDNHPLVFKMHDLGVLRESPRFFARKFKGDPKDPVRRAVLEQVRERSAAGAGAESDVARSQR